MRNLMLFSHHGREPRVIPDQVFIEQTRPRSAAERPVAVVDAMSFPDRSTQASTSMPTIDRIEAYADELTAIRRDFHAHPEIGFEERRTSAIVAGKLQEWGLETHSGIGRTGVVGVLRGRMAAGGTIGLRADMGARPMEEKTTLQRGPK